MHEKAHLCGWLAAALLVGPHSAAAAPAGPQVRIVVEGGVDRGPVRLHARYVEVDRRGFVERTRTEGRVVCTAPCEAEVPMDGASFRIAGPRVAPSRVFTLPERGPVEVHVRPRPRAVRPLGWVLGALGAAGLVAGATTMVIADDDRELLLAGGLTLAASIPLIITGAILARWGRTRVELRSATP